MKNREDMYWRQKTNELDRDDRADHTGWEDNHFKLKGDGLSIFES